MGVARHTQIVGPADVQTGLDVVPAERLGEVTDQLPLRLVLIEGTVAAVDAQSRTEVEAAVPLDESGRQA